MTTKPTELLPLAPPVYFLSDAHLGAAPPEVARVQIERLQQLFAEVETCNGTLVIVGDLFDFWFEWQSVVPKQHYRTLFDLRRLVEHRVAIHYLSGNHDFRLQGFLESMIGLHVHADDLAASINGQPIYVFHGDGVLRRDHGYRVLKRVLRSRFAQRAFSWLHPDLAMRLARGTSKTSRAYDHGSPEDDKDYVAFAQRKFAEGFTGVVMGHTHRPMEHREGQQTYINLGDWITQFTYGLHNGASLSLKTWTDATRRAGE